MSLAASNLGEESDFGSYQLSRIDVTRVLHAMARVTLQFGLVRQGIGTLSSLVEGIHGYVCFEGGLFGSNKNKRNAPLVGSLYLDTYPHTHSIKMICKTNISMACAGSNQAQSHPCRGPAGTRQARSC